MAHPFSNRPALHGVHDGLFGFGKGAPLADREDLTLAEFSRAIRPDTDEGTLWSDYAAMQTAIFNELRATCPAGRRELYYHMYATSLIHGFAQGHIVFSGLIASEQSRLHVGRIALDRLYRLAEAVGVLTVKSAEHGQGAIEVGNLNDIFARVEDAIGFDLTPPEQAGDLFGIKLDRGIISERHLDGIYGSWRMRSVLTERGHAPEDAIEIGGGGPDTSSIMLARWVFEGWRLSTYRRPLLHSILFFRKHLALITSG